MTDEEKYCETCNHIEMCKWTPISGCAFHSKYEQRPHGEWIFKNDNPLIPTGYWECSECKKGRLMVEENFCPKCGANMREGDSDA